MEFHSRSRLALKKRSNNLYLVKLRNIFHAHQNTHRRLLNCSNENEKARLEKNLKLYEQSIKKAISFRRASNTMYKWQPTSEKSSFFMLRKPMKLATQSNNNSNRVNSNNSSSSSHTNFTGVLVPVPGLKGYATQYLFRKQSSGAIVATMQSNMIGPTGLKLDGVKFVHYMTEKLPTAQQQQADDGLALANPETLSDTTTTSKTNDAEKALADFLANEELKRKNEYFRAMGLIPVEEYNNIMNQKKCRKRRTTANPQFSSAAIEAKAVTRMEILAERRYRQQLKQQNALKSTVKVQPNPSQVLFNDEHKATNYTGKASDSIKIDNKPISPGLYLVKKIINKRYYCTICVEQCSCQNDSIIVCKKCSFFFHLTCMWPKKEASKVQQVRCPKCSPPLPDSLNGTHSFTGKTYEHKLNEIQKYSNSLNSANDNLQKIYQTKVLQKSQLSNEIDRLNNQWNRFVHCMNILNLPTTELEDQANLKEVAQSETESEQRPPLTSSNDHASSVPSSTAPPTEHVMDSSSSIDDMVQCSEDLYSNLPKPQRDARRCDSDLPVITFCA